MAEKMPYNKIIDLLEHGKPVFGSFTFIDAPGATAMFVEGGINNLGDIVGDFDSTTGTHGFLLSGGMFTIIDAPGARATFAIGINDLDQIAGLFDPSDSTMHRMGFLATRSGTINLVSSSRRFSGLNPLVALGEQGEPELLLKG